MMSHSKVIFVFASARGTERLGSLEATFGIESKLDY